MNTISNKMVCVSQALAAKAKRELAGEIAKLKALDAANLLAQALVRALGEAQNCKTLRALREQVRERMDGVWNEHDTTRVLNTLRDCGIDSVADGLNGMLTSIVCIMNCQRNAEMAEHFQYFDRVKAGMFPVIHRRTELATTMARMAQAKAHRWSKLVGEYARNRLPAVAVSKAERKAKVREYVSSHFSGHYAGPNEGLYFYAGIAYEQKRMSTIGVMSTFKMWVLALRLNYQIWNVSHSKW